MVPICNSCGKWGYSSRYNCWEKNPRRDPRLPSDSRFQPLTGKTKCQCVQIRETRHRLWCREPAEANDIIIYLNSVHNDYPVEPNPNLIDFNVVDPQDTILSIQVAEVPVCHDLVDQFLPMFTQKI